jgi:hypothetical protein
MVIAATPAAPARSPRARTSPSGGGRLERCLRDCVPGRGTPCMGQASSDGSVASWNRAGWSRALLAAPRVAGADESRCCWCIGMRPPRLRRWRCMTSMQRSGRCRCVQIQLEGLWGVPARQLRFANGRLLRRWQREHDTLRLPLSEMMPPQGFRGSNGLARPLSRKQMSDACQSGPAECD